MGQGLNLQPSGFEYQRLGAALKEIEVDGSETASAIVAVRLLMLTGCRLSEIQKLRWEHVDLGASELRLPDTKTGAKVVYLGDPAIAVLERIDRRDGNPWVIAGRKPGSHLTDLQHPWRRIRARAGLDDVRIHDMRHSCASTYTKPLLLFCFLSYNLSPSSYSHRIRSNS